MFKDIETLCVQGGYEPKSGEARVLPIYQSTTYKYDDPKHLSDLFDLKAEGHIYSRISNPTLDGFEKKMASLENGVGAVSTSSGMSAILYSILNLCKAGDNFISLASIYGGSHTLFTTTLKDFGIEVRFLDIDYTNEDFKSLIDENTKCVFGESLTNPNLEILDIKKLSTLTKKFNLPLIIDNSLATPYLLRPIDYGANIVVHSATKYIDGHASSVGGIIIDGGNFDYTDSKFVDFNKEDSSYHGVIYTRDFKNLCYIIKLRVQLLRNIGSTLAPFNAYLFNLGLETLHLRMERHSQNAFRLAQYLETHEKVAWVNYPKLESNKYYDLSNTYLKKGGSGILSFGLKGGYEASLTLSKNLKLANLVVHLADVRTSYLHPASTTHRQLSDDELNRAGIKKELIRISVGIESFEDIKKDFELALSKI
ncbi:MAG: O-acetylhomoserine aminocarboxypropyltransferase/cysteine synthase [Peptostreptococcaceae bacterium]|jgi:O-acetylhomoserine (thiol)-lyase|nr:O-acetylhomoserine aminocarboxypropyltransferase/cysteine synthase [Peptostreptococcaceae bacterium]